jgi:hypothetical protein
LLVLGMPEFEIEVRQCQWRVEVRYMSSTDERQSEAAGDDDDV